MIDFFLSFSFETVQNKSGEVCMRKMIIIFAFFAFSCKQDFTPNDLKKSTLTSDISDFSVVMKKSSDGFRSDNGFLVPISFSYSPYSEKRECAIESIDVQFKGLEPIRRLSGSRLRKILARSNVVNGRSDIDFFLPIPYMSGPIEIVLHIVEYEFEAEELEKKQLNKDVGCRDPFTFRLNKVKVRNERRVVSTTIQELLLFTKVLPNLPVHNMDDTKVKSYLNALNEKMKSEWSHLNEEDLKKKKENFKYEFFR